MKRLRVCGQCGRDWLAWTCATCGSTVPRRTSGATMRRLRDDYDQKGEGGMK